MNYYNDNDPYCVQWLRNLVAANALPAGTIDGRSILDLEPADLAGYRQCHFERHLWPQWLRLIRECRPDTILGEQVAGAVGFGWIDRVFNDLENEGYACGAAVLGAHSVNAPHNRTNGPICRFWQGDIEMKSLLLRIGTKIRKTGVIDGNDVIRLLDYHHRHPMWRVTADDATLRAFDAVMAEVKGTL